jgi:transmembrane sensor
MDYLHYSVEDFMLDEQFQRWVKQPDAEANAYWENWLAAHPYKRETLMEARQAILEMTFREDVPAYGQYEKVWEKIIAENKAYDRRQAKKLKTFPVYRWHYGYAAAVITAVLILAGGAFFLVNQPQITVFATGYGETQTLTLPDNSTVILNANSRLTLPANWEKRTNREVWLEGEAFFSVVHTVNHQKFIVHTTDQLQIEVLGTEFNVYQRKRGTRVILNSGKVQLSIKQADTRAQQVSMQPGELVELTDTAAGFVKKTVNPDIFSAWTQHELVFADTPVMEIVNLLEENYGLTVKLTDKNILTRTISGSLPSDNLESLLFALSESLNYQITKRNQTVTFHKRPAK